MMQTLILYRDRGVYFSRVIPASRYPRSLSRAIDCRKHRRSRVVSRRVVSQTIHLSVCPYVIRDAFSTSIVLPPRDRCLFPVHLSDRLDATSLPLSRITVISRGRRIPRLDLSGGEQPCASSNWNFARIVQNLPMSLCVTTFDLPYSIKWEREK